MRNWKSALWRSIDLALCVFCGLVCGVLSYRDLIRILGVIAFTAGLVPVFGKRLYHAPAKAVRVMMVVFRILLALLLAVGSVHFWISFTNMMVSFT